MFTVDGYNSDTDSLEGKNLLVDPLKIDGLAQQVGRLSKLTTPNGDITCKLDTGAEANVLPTTAVRPPLQPTKTRLTAYGGSPINFIATCELQYDINESNHKVKFYVVNVDSQPMLGLRHCEKLGFIKRIDVIHTGQLTKEYQTNVQNCLYRTGKPGKVPYNITKWLHSNVTQHYKMVTQQRSPCRSFPLNNFRCMHAMITNFILS